MIGRRHKIKAVIKLPIKKESTDAYSAEKIVVKAEPQGILVKQIQCKIESPAHTAFLQKDLPVTNFIESEGVDQKPSLEIHAAPRPKIRPQLTTRRNSTQQQHSSLDTKPDELKVPKLQKIVARPNVYVSRIRTESCSSTFSGIQKDKLHKIGLGAEENQRIGMARKEFLTKFAGKKPDKSSLKMCDLIYYNPVTNPMKTRRDDSIVIKAEKIESTFKTPEAPPILSVKEAEPCQGAAPVPQLKIGPNGDLILDEKSLVIQTTGAQEASKTLSSYNLVYLDEHSGSNGFYKRHKRTRDWVPEETIKFYRCLHTVGTDFSLMLTLFPNRTRRDLKLKFKKEERQNSRLVNKALLFPKIFNINELKKELLDRETELKQQQNILEQKILIRKSRSKNKTRVERALQDGDFLYENEQMLDTAKVLRYAEKEINKRSVSLKQEETENSVIFNKKNLKLVDIALGQISDESNTSISEPPHDEKVLKHERPSSPSSTFSQTEDDVEMFDEEDIELIQTVIDQINDGTLVVIATQDRNLPHKISREIFVMCSETGTLSEKPLQLPKEVLDFIFSKT